MAINGVSSIFNNNSILGLYNTINQNNMALYNNKLSKSVFPVNNALNSNPLNSGSMQYVTNIKSASKNLSSSIRSLSGGAAFMKKTMTSSDNDVLSVNYSGSIFNRPGNTTVDVKQIAAGQANKGADMKQDDAFGEAGTYKFSIDVNGKSTELSVNVAAGDKNKDVQQKMADAINKAGIGVKAAVESDSEKKTSSLKIESAGIGDDEKNKFAINDTEGGLAAKLGVDKATQEAQDALYSVNGGKEQSSKSNTVDIGGGMNVTFKKASDKAVTISQGMDLDFAKSSVNNLVKNYNDMYVEALKNAKDPKAEALASRLLNVSKTYSGSLSKVGIGFDKDGMMTINEAQFNKAAENGDLEKFFRENSGKNYGFTNQLGKLADNVSRNTSNYVSKSLFGSDLMENFSYSNAGSLMSYDFMSSGWLLDYLY